MDFVAKLAALSATGSQLLWVDHDSVATHAHPGSRGRRVLLPALPMISWQPGLPWFQGGMGFLQTNHTSTVSFATPG